MGAPIELTNKNITIRPFRMDMDVKRLLDLRIAIEAVDHVDTNTSEQALQAEFNWNGHHPEKDRWVVEAVDLPESFLGHAWVFHQTAKRSILHVAVHPSYRRQGVGSELLEKVIGRSKDMGAVQIVAGAEKKNIIGASFLKNRGFAPVGHNRHMIAPSNTKIDLPDWPVGFKVCTFAELKELAYIVEACNACYTDMWGHGENSARSTVDSYSQLMQKYPDHYFPEGIFVLFSPNGDVAGICFGRIERDENDEPRKVIDSPGVVPKLRYLKLQRQLVITTMNWLNTVADGEFHLLSWGDTDEAATIYQDLGFILNLKNYTIEYLLKNED